MCLTGLQDVEVFHYKKKEAVEGQDVALPCLLNRTNVQLGNIEWSKSGKETTKLVVYNAMYGYKYFWPNVTIQIENNTLGAYLLLNGVTRWDSGTYVCELSTFPLGSIRTETVLKITGKTNSNPCRAVSARRRISHRRRRAATFCLIVRCIYFHVAPDCIRALLLCQPHQLFTLEQMYEIIARTHLL